MAVDNVTTSSTVGVDGNSYTSSISNDKLTNDDFLRLMLEEMKMQDPTKPMDSAALMDSQLKMSTIEANIDMQKAMNQLQASYASSALSTAANMIGHIVEDGQIGDDGLAKSYKVETVENKDGELFATARQLIGLEDVLKNTDTESMAEYDSAGIIYEDGVQTDYRVALDTDYRFTYNDDQSLKLLDQNGDIVTDEAITSKYVFAGSSVIYSQTTDLIAFNNILEVR